MNKPFADYFHTNKGFDTAYRKGYEIWFKCKSYYYVNYNYLKNNDDYNEISWKNGEFRGE